MKVLNSALAAAMIFAFYTGSAAAKSPADLNDVEIAHVAYTADNIDIRYAHLALAISSNSTVRAFAETMIRDHSAVNEQALGLLKKLNVSAKDNFLSQTLSKNAEKIIDEISKLRGSAFDKRYAENELAYHKAINDLVGKTFIPNIKNPDVKKLFKAGLNIFKTHEKHAEMMVRKVQ